MSLDTPTIAAIGPGPINPAIAVRRLMFKLTLRRLSVGLPMPKLHYFGLILVASSLLAACNQL